VYARVLVVNPVAPGADLLFCHSASCLTRDEESIMVWQKRGAKAEVIVEALKKKVLVVEEQKIRRLKKALGAKSESEAVRIAVEETLNAHEMIQALKALREYGKRRGWGVPTREKAPT
jgi:hypothetical protein